MLGDRELLSFRQDYYSLLVALFREEPSAALLQGLAGGITERIAAARNLNPLLAEGWVEINRFLSETPSENLAERVADEYTRLFIGPHGLELNPYESFYLTGRLLDRPLANLRTVLKALGIEKQDGYAEPEDFLAFELEVMRWLTAKQQAAAAPEEEKRRLLDQAEFLKQHLLIWVPTCAEDIERAQGARFYHGAAKLLRGFLELERTHFSEWGMDKVASLEEVRRLYGAIPMWKGPTFEFSPGEVAKGPAPSREK
jgi:TorA maturation chaperone TorD